LPRDPLLDQQIACATVANQVPLRANGENAIVDGYVPFTQELGGHGIYYLNPNLTLETRYPRRLDIERPVGLEL